MCTYISLCVFHTCMCMCTCLYVHNIVVKKHMHIIHTCFIMFVHLLMCVYDELRYINCTCSFVRSSVCVSCKQAPLSTPSSSTNSHTEPAPSSAKNPAPLSTLCSTNSHTESTSTSAKSPAPLSTPCSTNSHTESTSTSAKVLLLSPLRV